MRTRLAITALSGPLKHAHRVGSGVSVVLAGADTRRARPKCRFGTRDTARNANQKTEWAWFFPRPPPHGREFRGSSATPDRGSQCNMLIIGSLNRAKMGTGSRFFRCP